MGYTHRNYISPFQGFEKFLALGFAASVFIV
jgi:hypothetical protein